MLQPAKRLPILLIMVLATLASFANAACPSIFYAAPIEYEKAKVYDFYETEINMNSASECASFCGNKQICRTAVYNHDALTCALSYLDKIDCEIKRERYNLFYLPATQSTPLSVIACIDQCKLDEKKSDVFLEPLYDNKILTKEFTKIFNPKFAHSTPRPSPKLITVPALSEAETVTPPHLITGNGQVNFNVKPLNIEGTSGENGTFLQKMHNVTIVRKESGGIVAFKPSNGKVRLITMNPEAFATLYNIKNAEEFEKVSNSAGTENVEVDSEDLDGVIEAIRKQIATTSQNSAISQASKIQHSTSDSIVVNGKILSPKQIAALLEYEATTTTTTTTPIPNVLTTEEGYLNTFVIHGVGNMFKEAIKDQRELDSERQTPGCFKTIPQQTLYRAGFKVFETQLTLKQCQCKCSATWQTSKTEPKCKSIQFKEDGGVCTLNRADHNGKYDLIFNKVIDYYYINCELRDFLDVSEGACGEYKEDGREVVDNLGGDEERSTSGEDVNHSNNAKKNDSRQVDSDVGGRPERILISEIELKPAPTRTTVFNAGITMTTTTTKAPATSILTSITESPVTTTTTTTVAPPITTSTTEILTTTTEKLTTTPTTTAATTTTTTAEAPTTTVTTMTTTGSSTTATTTTITNTSKPCFERFDNHKLTRLQPFGLEHDVTLEECQCFCANSKISKRYNFQCLSAVYYHSDKDCILYLGNRQLHRDALVETPTDNAATYLGMVCPLSQTITTHVKADYIHGCLEPSTKTTTMTTITTVTANSDQCFNEKPNHILEGTALAVENNITVEECKCRCIDSESLYGSDCQSIQYFYNTQTCMLNKENQITDSENFVYDPYTEQTRSYFDYTCRTEQVVLGVYIEQVCQKILNVNLEVLGLAKSNSSKQASSKDEASEEVQKSSNPMNDTLMEINLPTTTTMMTKTTPSPTPTISTKTTLVPIRQDPAINEMEELTESEEENLHAHRYPTTKQTTTPTSTTTTTGYKPTGSCSYSALYQTVFNGNRMIKSLIVTSPKQCFDACHAERCRSANLIQLDGILKNCELYKDAIIDFRRTDVISFDASAVHFNAISCEDK